MPESAKLSVALLQALSSRQSLDLLEMLEQVRLEGPGRRFAICMRAAQGFRHNLVHQSQLQQVRGRDLERFGRRGVPSDQCRVCGCGLTDQECSICAVCYREEQAGEW